MLKAECSVSGMCYEVSIIKLSTFYVQRSAYLSLLPSSYTKYILSDIYN